MHTAGRRDTSVQSHFTVVANEANFTAAAKSVHSVGTCASIVTGTGATLVQIYLTVTALRESKKITELYLVIHKIIYSLMHIYYSSCMQ